MKGLLAVAIVVVVLGGGVLLGFTQGGRPGSPDVYARMDAEMDCAVLQAEFDQASYNHDHIASNKDASLAYMEYADERMREVGCY